MEESLKKLLKAIRLNEGTISMFLGLAVVVIVTGMIVNYFRETPTQLPTANDTNIADNQTLNTINDTNLNIASPSANPTQTLAQAPTLAPTSTPRPTNTPVPTFTPIPTATTVPTLVPTKRPTLAPTTVPTLSPTATVAPQGQIASGVTTTAPAQANNNTYTVQAGDDLWHIAEQQYGTGYAWVEIAQANNIANPNIIVKDAQLNLPELSKAYPTTLANAQPATGGSVTQIAPTQPNDNTQVSATNAITTDTYTVVRGDSLWSIAQRAYNDGFQWIKISQSNNLSNPRIIEIGTTLTIPRS